MDDFREWLSDNLRYILLGLAIIIVLVIAFFAVRFVTDRLGGDSDIKQTEAGTEAPASETAAGSETETETAAATEAANPLQTDNTAIQEAVTQYYTARVAAKDFDTLQNLGDVVGDTDRDKINSIPLSYNNIAIYYKSDLTDITFMFIMKPSCRTSISWFPVLEISIWRQRRRKSLCGKSQF